MRTKDVRTATALALLAGTLVACSSNGTGPKNTGPDEVLGNGSGNAVRLVSFDACGDLLSHLKRQGSALVGPYGLPGDNVPLAARAGAEDGSAEKAPTAPGASAEGRDYSGTNVQEAGVDEPDQVKTDGRHIYAVRGDKVVIVDTTGAKPRTVETLTAGYDAKLLLDGDRLLVASSAGDRIPGPVYDDVPGKPRGSKSGTTVTLYDISDPAQAERLSTLRMDGRTTTARLVGGTAHLVQRTDPELPWVQPKGGSNWLRDRMAEGEATDKNRALIEKSTLDAWLPQYSLTGSDGRTSKGRLVECGNAWRTREFSGFGLTSVVSLDLGGDLKPTKSSGVLTGSDTVYASKSRLYVAGNQWHNWIELSETERRQAASKERTDLHAFRIDAESGPSYLGSGRVRGRLLNQFSMSEHKGVLRVATTDQPRFSREAPDPDGSTSSDDPREQSQSYVTTFAERDRKLVQLGQVGGLGKNERIYAVRFMGDVGYVVTFRQTDPLYTLDLSMPAKPKVLGELKIPGYSAYLHPIGDGLVIGVGQDANTQGRTQGLQMSLFDVSDLAKPKRLHKTTIAGAHSEVEWSHLGFLYWPRTRLMVVPFNAYPENETGAIGFTVDRERGFTEVDTITHEETQPYDGRGQVSRSMVIGDSLYTLSGGALEVADLDTLKETARLDLPAPTYR